MFVSSLTDGPTIYKLRIKKTRHFLKIILFFLNIMEGERPRAAGHLVRITTAKKKFTRLVKKQ